MSLVSQTIPHLKKIIIKTILRKNSFAPITISKAKLYSALISSRSFYYSDLEGALCFVVDVQNGCFRFLLYDLDSYETLLNIELPQSLKLLYIKLKPNFHSLEIKSGFFGFLFEEDINFCEQMFTTINKIDPKIINELTESFNYSNNFSTNNFDILKNKLMRDYGIAENCQKLSTIENNSISFNLRNINEILNCFSYDENEKYFEYYGNMQKGKEFLDKNKINESEISISQIDDLHIKNCEYYVSILVNHIINDIKLKPKINELKAKNKETIAQIKQKLEEEQNAKEMEILKKLDSERQTLLAQEEANRLEMLEKEREKEREKEKEKNKQKKGVPKPPPFPIISKKKPTKKTFVIPVEKKIKRESIIPDTIIEEQGKQNNEESNELRNNKEENIEKPQRMLPPQHLDMFAELKTKLGKRESNFDFSKFEANKKQEPKKEEVIDFRKLIKKKVDDKPNES